MFHLDADGVNSDNQLQTITFIGLMAEPVSPIQP